MNKKEVIETFNNYEKNMSKNICESKQGTGVKILSSKQMLQSSCTNERRQ